MTGIPPGAAEAAADVAGPVAAPPARGHLQIVLFTDDAEISAEAIKLAEAHGYLFVKVKNPSYVRVLDTGLSWAHLDMIACCAIETICDCSDAVHARFGRKLAHALCPKERNS